MALHHRERTDVTCASKGNSCREPTDAATYDGNLEFLESRGQRGRERRIHEKVRVFAGESDKL